MKTDPTTAALRRVQQALRSMPQVAPQDSVRSARVPGTRGRETRYVIFNAAAKAAVENAAGRLAIDERFEHLEKPGELVWELAMAVYLDKGTDHVAQFVARHERAIEEHPCFVTVDYLATTSPWRVGEVDFLPTNHESIPERNGWFQLDSSTRTIAVVGTRGTDRAKMAQRGRTAVETTLRLLRLDIFHSQPGVRDEQLWFRCGQAIAFSDGVTGWQRYADSASDLEGDSDLAAHFAQSAVGTLLTLRSGDLTTSLEVAAGWLERATFTTDPLTDILFSFFALEALLGRKSDTLKGDSLAVRQMTLDHEFTGGFAHPNRLWLQYDTIRSVAVHGGGMPLVDEADARSLRHAVTRTLDQVITFANRESLRRKSEVLTRLDSHEDLPKLAEWLIKYGGADWRAYLETLVSVDVVADATENG